MLLKCKFLGRNNNYQGLNIITNSIRILLLFMLCENTNKFVVLIIFTPIFRFIFKDNKPLDQQFSALMTNQIIGFIKPCSTA